MNEKLPKEIIFYIPSLNSGGAERQCAYVASTLNSEGNAKCSIVLTRSRPFSKVNRDRVYNAGVAVYEFAWFKPVDLIRLFCFFFKNRTATLFCYLTFPSFFGCILARIAGLKNCYGGIRCSKLPSRFLLMEIFTHYFFSKKTIFNSYCGRDNFLKLHFNAKKSLVISNMIAPASYIKDYSVPAGNTVRIITVGRFTLEKDYHTFIRVVRQLFDEELQISPIIIGYGELEKDIKGWISQENLMQCIRIIDGRNDANIEFELSISDIYLSTSIYEGTSNSIMEAMNVGLPVVATDVGDNVRLIDDGSTGFICRSGDVNDIAKKVKALIDNPIQRRTFGEKGMLKMREAHSVESIAKQYLSLVDS